MSRVQKYSPFAIAALVLWVVLFIIYPHYQYYIDPDGTAYLTISKRYANGDILRAINGYWSPWACWLTAALIRCGASVIPASVIVNTAGATGFLFISQSFFVRFGVQRRMQWLLCITLALFLCYAVFWQSFDDLWECAFLLATLRLVLMPGYEHRFGLWVLSGIIGTLAYFAKAYSFPFFILNTLCCTWLISDSKLQWLKISATAIGAMLFCSLPWIWVLHNKYGIWTTSTAGTLNTSWYLVGHPHWKEGIKLLIPPAYPDSPYYWEDPWFANGDTPHFWDSLSLLGSEVMRTGYHAILFVLSGLQLSVFFPLIAIAAAVSLLVKKYRSNLTRDMRILTLSFLLFPLGYLLVNFESRYLWYMVPLSMVLGAVMIQNSVYKYGKGARFAKALFLISYLLVPAFGLIMMYNNGKAEYQLAGELKKANVSGTFTGNAHPRFMARVAYFSGSQYYFLLYNGRGKAEGLPDEVRKYGVQYFIHLDPEFLRDAAHQDALFNDYNFLSGRKEVKRLYSCTVYNAE